MMQPMTMTTISATMPVSFKCLLEAILHCSCKIEKFHAKYMSLTYFQGMIVQTRDHLVSI